jgi:xylitol oxidase
VVHNWADNYTFSAGRIHRPVSVDEVRSLVARSSHVRAIGARHSFNGSADSAGDLIDLSGIDPGFLIDARRRTVTVGGGTNYGVLAAHLQSAGWALHNMASLPHVSIAGAIATRTHGSGDRLGNLSSAVAALDIVSATGDLVTIRRGDPDFDGAVVALGALGIVTRVTLDIQPTFEVRQDAFEGLPWSNVISDFDTIMSAGYSVSLMTSWSGPTVTRLWIKTRLGRGVARATSPADLGAAPAAHPSARPTPGGNGAAHSIWSSRPMVRAASAFPTRCRTLAARSSAERIHGSTRPGDGGDHEAPCHRRPRRPPPVGD